MTALRLCLLLCATLWTGQAGAQSGAQSDTARAAQAAADRLEAASLLLEAATGSSDQIAVLTETVQAYEDGLTALRDGLRRAAVRQGALNAELASRSDEVAQLLAVLMTMGRAPAPLLLLHPSGPAGTARSGMILADVTPALQVKVDALRLSLEELAQLQDIQDSAAETLRRGLAGAQQARAALSEAVSNRTDLPQRFTEDEVGTALLIASTETLDAFASGLDGNVSDAQDMPLPDARARMGQFALPVQGDLLRGFNMADAAGVERPGIIVATRPRALVTAPFAATLRYRGPLLDYGNVMILEPAADVLVVFAGLAEVFGETGQVLPEGTPIGLMGGQAPEVDAILTETAQGGGAQRSETLYIEVRDGQLPVDPATWFAVE